MDVGKSFRNRLTRIIAGRSPSKLIPKEMMEQIDELPPKFKDSLLPYITGETSCNISVSVVELLIQVGAPFFDCDLQVDAAWSADVEEDETAPGGAHEPPALTHLAPCILQVSMTSKWG